MSSIVQHKAVCEAIFAALARHDADEAVSYYDANCEVSFDGKTVMRSKEELRKDLQAECMDPNFSLRVIKYIPVDSDDRIRLVSENNKHVQYDETIVFSSEGKIIQLLITTLGN